MRYVAIPWIDLEKQDNLRNVGEADTIEGAYENFREEGLFNLLCDEWCVSSMLVVVCTTIEREDCEEDWQGEDEWDWMIDERVHSKVMHSKVIRKR